ncbi:glycine cleavage T C-terminal barrel domain-containing protein [Epibacterium sp. Ofav1-8]|uniref:glycine cleavage T C-terminal barrel domain-containing protein n=1 Tax=Epibacterium sp. Ofav1-8 TaxID=2917735 RepID=UPI001EF61F4D|nr:glycine cleavage T C-terminal barrel domain-containing protein [Epibacterium sp. Ofav1-8]MCG7624785.1 glycine cleavage system protein T [Epibacterium sp. Ofav1-8]
MTFSIAIGPNIRKSAYFDATVRDGVRGFSVYNHMYIPGNFGDPAGEYDRLINGVAMWDVAAQRQVELQGPDAGRLAQYLTPRDLSKTRVGQGRYVPLCDHAGWLINDPVLLKLSEDRYWLSVADSDIHLWAAAIGRERGWAVEVREPDVSPLAIQGPKAADVTAALFGDWVRELRYFGFRQTELDGIPLVLARSGWSKQGGFELYLQDRSRGLDLWDRVKAAGVPFDIGPGAPNDIERLESGLISYGADMRWQDTRATPFEMGFGPLIDLDSGHDFVGRAALSRLAAEPPARQRVGLTIADTPPLPGSPVPLWQGDAQVGHVTEFAYSPRLGTTIGHALIRADLAEAADGLHLRLEGRHHAAALNPIPFVK